MEIFDDIELPEIPGAINDNDEQKELSLVSTVTVKIDCRNCAAKGRNCHRRCPQMSAVSTADGKAVTGELLRKGRRARVHKDVNVTFGKFMGLLSELEG